MNFNLVPKLALIAALTLLTSNAYAIIRPIIIPGKMATIMMQAMSAAGGGELDPEPRALYDAIAMPEQDGPSGGKGKVIGTAEKDFNLVCAFRSVVTPLNVICTITVKPSPRVRISANEAEFVAEGPDAAAFYEKFAGPGATQPFVWRSQNGWISIESQAERFVFHFKH
jgi:hypothetical protein